jgi:hypothetical protein
VDAPENSFDLEVTCAWTSMPMTTSQSRGRAFLETFGVGLSVHVTLLRLWPPDFPFRSVSGRFSQSCPAEVALCIPRNGPNSATISANSRSIRSEHAGRQTLEYRHE